LTDFTAGELTPKFSGRVDLPIYTRGCLELENWVPYSAGGITTRPGSKYLGLTKSGAAGVLIPFILTTTLSGIVEVTPSLIRIWYNDALFGAPLELATSYTAAQLLVLRTAQDGPRLFFFHPSHAISVLTWTGATFTFAAASLVGNTNQVPFSSAGNYPAWGAFFAGRLWCGGTTNDPQGVWGTRSFVYTWGDPWEALTGYEVGDVVLSDTSKLYKCVTKGVSSAATPPTGTGSAIADGTVVWDYWCAEGCLDFTYFDRISYTSTQLVDPTLWTDPDTPELETITTYREVVSESSAMWFTIASDRGDSILNAIAGRKVMILCTASSEYAIPDDISPLDPKAGIRSRFSSDTVQPILIHENILFLQRHRTRLREYQYGDEGQMQQSPDLTFHADHVFGAGGAVDLDFALVPEPMVYCVRTDGELAVLLYNRAAGAFAWHRYVLGASALYESIAVVPESTGDCVYAIVNRGTGYRCVEKFDLIGDSTSIPLDSWVNVATASATLTGLERFNGKTVTIYNVTDGTVRTGTVSTGTLTFNAADVGDHVVVGVGFTCTMKTMRVTSQAAYGTGHMRTRRIGKVFARFLASYPCKLGYTDTAALLEEAPITGPYTGDMECPFNGNWDRDTWVMAIQDGPYHTTILALAPEVDT